jgi:hypothetical protein
MSNYFENFKEVSDVIEQYQAPADALEGATVHLAWYGYGSYCGDSLVIFEKDGKLFEVNGSHCSCSGLEGQWEPEETSWAALSKRDLSGECDGSKDATEYLQKIVSEHLISN